MSRTPLGVTVLAAAAVALGVLGPAAARTHAPPRYGGTLVVGLSGSTTVTDPTVGGSITIFLAMCERLYGLDAKLRLRPLLAATVPALSKDKLSYTIQLRKGVQFNDGTPFNAQALATSVQHFITYPGSLRKGDFANVDSVTASGPYTVVYHLKERDSTFTANSYVLSPTQLAKLGDNFASNPICVGPFMFDHQVAGDHTTVIKSPYYYDRDHVYLDKIVYKSMPDAAAATAALKAGDIHALALSTTELPGVRQTSSLRVIQTPQLAWQGIIINIGNKNGQGNLPYAANVGTPLSSSAKLRQAFEEAIDRETLNKIVFGGLYQPSCTAIAPSNTLWYDATKVSCTPYAPRHAKKLVAAAGFPNPTVHLLVDTTTDRLRLAQFIQAQEAAVGINVIIDSFDAATVADRQRSGNFDAAVDGFAPGSPEPNLMIFQFLATGGIRNWSGYSSPRLDLILTNGVKATSIEARSTLYHVAQQVIAADRPILVFYNRITFAAFSTSLTGVELANNGSMLVANARFK